MSDLQICCHFTTHTSATDLKTNDETITFLVCLFVLSEQLVHNLRVTYVARVLQMLEASRNASRFEDTIEYAIFTNTFGITFNRVFPIIEVLQIQLNTCFSVNNRIRVLQSLIESHSKIRVLQSIIELLFEVNNRPLANMKQELI